MSLSETKYQLEFIISLKELDKDIISNTLGISATRSFNKGDPIIINGVRKDGFRPHGIWALGRTRSCYDIDLKEDFEYFNEIIQIHGKKILKLKDKYGFSVSMNLLIETEDYGISFDLDKEYMTVFYKIIDRFTCFFTPSEITPST